MTLANLLEDIEKTCGHRARLFTLWVVRSSVVVHLSLSLALLGRDPSEPDEDGERVRTSAPPLFLGFGSNLGCKLTGPRESVMHRGGQRGALL